MKNDKCTEKTRVTRIVVEEKKRKATFLNEDRSWFYKTQVDGCLCQNEEAADWVISKDGVGALVIELKGRDASHAIRQVLTTAQFWRQRHPDCQRIAGLIVCSQRPSYSTSVQRGQLMFSKAHKSRLRVLCGNKEYRFEEMLSFDS